MKLYLEKRGCDFFKNDTIQKVSDVGNYRVCTHRECILGKDGKMYFLEFTNGERRKVRYENKRTGKPLKKPITEVVMAYSLCLNTQYTENGLSYRNLKIEKDFYNKEPMLYTLENILKVVNDISINHYDEIVFVDR